jgi:hypothetical protein
MMTKKELQEQNRHYQEAIAQSNRDLEQISWELYLDGQKELAYRIWKASVEARPEITLNEYIASLDRPKNSTLLT